MARGRAIEMIAADRWSRVKALLFFDTLSADGAPLSWWSKRGVNESWTFLQAACVYTSTTCGHRAHAIKRFNFHELISFGEIVYIQGAVSYVRSASSCKKEKVQCYCWTSGFSLYHNERFMFLLYVFRVKAILIFCSCSIQCDYSFLNNKVIYVLNLLLFCYKFYKTVLDVFLSIYTKLCKTSWMP